MLPAMDTVNRTKITDKNTTIRVVAACRRNKLLAAMLSVNRDFDSALKPVLLLSPKYCTGESALTGGILAASSIGFAPNINAKTKNAANTNGANQRFGALL